MYINEKLEKFTPSHKFFIGIDSDGTAFDSMEIKHKDVFIPIAVQLWNLKSIEREFREISEFVNLYSDSRGINRFAGLLIAFEYLSERLKYENTDNILPDYSDLREFVNSGLTLSNLGLEEFMERKHSVFLEEVFNWSKDSDVLFSELTKGIKPYNGVKKSLQRASKDADIMVISLASTAGLHKDWEEGGLLQYISLVAGQEAGSKEQQLKYAITKKYEKNKVLMIGDAPGDLNAARKNNTLFYPIKPGQEEESWEFFYSEAYNKFISGDYAGIYEEALIEEFLKLLPHEKTWENK